MFKYQQLEDKDKLDKMAFLDIAHATKKKHNGLQSIAQIIMLEKKMDKYNFIFQSSVEYNSITKSKRINKTAQR